MLKFLSLMAIIIGGNAEGDKEMKMISDVISSTQRPTVAVAAVSCWNAKQKMTFYSNLATNDRLTAKISLAKITKVNNFPDFEESKQHLLFVVDLACGNVTDFLTWSNSRKLFRFPYRWLFFSSSPTTEVFKDSIPAALDNVDTLPDSEVIVARSLENNTFELHYVHKVAVGYPWKTEFFAVWKPDFGLIKSSTIVSETIALRRLNLDGFAIPICYVVISNESIHHMEDRKDDHIDTITKVNYLTSLHLMDFLNTTREVVFVNTWGYNTNGTWNGLTGYLLRDEVEIGGTPMFFTSERVSIVEFISSPTPTRSKFVFLQPKLSYENNLFLLPFQTNVWYCSVALLFLIFLVLLLVSVWEWKKENHDEKTMEPGILRANIVDVAVLTLGATCQQGSPVELKGSLGRVVMLVLFLALMFLYTSYSANIVALLQSSSSQIHTLEDLLHSRLKFGVQDTIYNRYYFSTATEPVRQAIYNTKVAPPGATPRFMSMQDGVLNIRKGLFAFHMETDVGYKFVGKFFHEGEKCGLKEIQYLQVIDPWLAVRKNTPYMEMFKIGFKRIHEHGLQARENLMFYQKKPRCANRGANFISVSMVDCYPALLVLTYGTLVSIGLLILEVLVFKRENIVRRLLCLKS